MPSELEDECLQRVSFVEGSDSCFDKLLERERVVFVRARGVESQPHLAECQLKRAADAFRAFRILVVTAAAACRAQG